MYGMALMGTFYICHLYKGVHRGNGGIRDMEMKS